MIDFRYQGNVRISQTRMEAFFEHLENYRVYLEHVADKHTYDDPESSFNVPFDDAIEDEVREVADKLKTKSLKYVFVVGIGGANLGTKAVYDALGGHYDALKPTKPKPQLIFLDTPSPDLFAQIGDIIAKLKTANEFAVNVISKSGGTTETLFNVEVLMSLLRKKVGAKADTRLVVTTQENSPLWKDAHKRKLHTLKHPSVGGRYSVFTQVGLFPLLLAGIDIEQLRKGARDMRTHCLSEGDENIAMASAVGLYSNFLEGISIHDSFFFAPHLHSIGLWYRQLMGESIGKEQNRDGQIIHAGMTPTVSIGSNDLHATLQLYLGGPRDKITTFVWCIDETKDISMPKKRLFPSVVPMIDDRTAEEVLSAILEGTKIAYKKAGLPFMEAIFETIDAYSVGEFLQFKMLEMMYLGYLLNVNAFDQPAVEGYKRETKNLLGD